MRRRYLLLTLLIFATLHAVGGWARAQAIERKVAAAVRKVDEVTARGPFKPVWESLEQKQVPGQPRFSPRPRQDGLTSLSEIS